MCMYFFGINEPIKMIHTFCHNPETHVILGSMGISCHCNVYLEILRMICPDVDVGIPHG